MLRIHNALSRAGFLTIEDVDRSGEIPRLKKTLDPDAEQIWNKYFILIYDKLGLPGKLSNRRKLIKRYLPNLERELFDKAGVNKRFLLELLIEDPEKIIGRVRETLTKNEDDTEDTIKEKNQIRAAFGYDDVSKKTGFAELVMLLDVNVCPYCGRMFTTTAKKKGSEYMRANQVDHYYPKSLYPYLAVSIWNWIPSCGPCNNHKSDDVTERFLYPYAESMGDEYRFTTHIRSGVGYLIGKRGSENEFALCLEPTEACLADSEKEGFRARADYEIEKVGVRALYASHNSYVGDIFRQRYVFGDAYQDSLVASFPDLFKSRADVRALLYMKSIEAEDIGKAPLDKLTRDIDHEIDILNDPL